MRLPASIGRAELEILHYIMDHHPATVREVADHLAETKGHTRTTALNVMERLRQKGYLVRRKEDGSYQYSPSLSRAQLSRSLVHDFVDQMLGGSLEPFVAYLTQEARVSDAQMQELKRLVRELDAPREEIGDERVD